MSALKEPVQIDYKKACSVWKKQQYQHSADIFVEKVFNPFHGTSLFLYSLKYIRKPEVFLDILWEYRKRPVP